MYKFNNYTFQVTVEPGPWRLGISSQPNGLAMLERVHVNKTKPFGCIAYTANVLGKLYTYSIQHATFSCSEMISLAGTVYITMHGMIT